MLFCSWNMNYKNFVMQSSLFHILQFLSCIQLYAIWNAIENLIYKSQTIYKVINLLFLTNAMQNFNSLGSIPNFVFLVFLLTSRIYTFENDANSSSSLISFHANLSNKVVFIVHIQSHKVSLLTQYYAINFVLSKQNIKRSYILYFWNPRNKLKYNYNYDLQNRETDLGLCFIQDNLLTSRRKWMKSKCSLLWLTKVCFLSWLHVVQIVLCGVRHCYTGLFVVHIAAHTVRWGRGLL